MVMPMISTEMDEDDQYDSPLMPDSGDKPKYPPGMFFSMDEKLLAKMKIDPADLFKGATMHMHGLINVVRIDASDGEYGKTCCIRLCIENMAIESEDAENKENK